MHVGLGVDDPRHRLAQVRMIFRDQNPQRLPQRHRASLLHWKKSPVAIFSRPYTVGRRQKAWFLPPASSRSYARAGKIDRL
jgi:hypothetical protein